MNPRHIQMFMQMAVVASRYSHAKKLQVGSLFVRDGRILSIGINGTAAGTDNTCEDKVWESNYQVWGDDGEYKLVTKDTVIHSEQSAMYKAARDGESLRGSSLFVTTQPCLMCSLGLVACGVSEVYYLNDYRNQEGIDNLKKHNIIVRQITLEN